jgi:hypothetical protein
MIWRRRVRRSAFSPGVSSTAGDLVLLVIVLVQDLEEHLQRGDFASASALGALGLVQQEGRQPFIGAALRFRAHLLNLLLLHHAHSDAGQIAHHRIDIAPDIADFGELGRLDLDERRAHQHRQPTRNFGLADACGTNHQDIFGQDFVAQLGRELLTAVAVAQGNRDGALSFGLSDDILIQLRHYLARRERLDRDDGLDSHGVSVPREASLNRILVGRAGLEPATR